MVEKKNQALELLETVTKKHLGSKPSCKGLLRTPSGWLIKQILKTLSLCCVVLKGLFLCQANPNKTFLGTMRGKNLVCASGLSGQRLIPRRSGCLVEQNAVQLPAATHRHLIPRCALRSFSGRLAKTRRGRIRKPIRTHQQ